MFQWLRRFKSSMTWNALVRLGWAERNPNDSSAETYSEPMEMYRRDPWTFSCIQAVAQAIAKMPLVVATKDGKTLTSHPILDLLAEPNNRESRYDFIYATMVYLECRGFTVWEKTRNSYGRPGNLFVLRPDRLCVMPTEDRRDIAGFQYVNRDGRPTQISWSDSVYIKYFDPLDDWYGMGTLNPLMDSSEIDLSATKWMKRFTSKYGELNGYLHTDKMVGPSEQRKLSMSWRSRLTDPDSTAVLPKGLQHEKTGTDPKSGGVADFDSMTRSRKMAATGVPPVKLGILSDSKTSTYGLQTRAFVKDALEARVFVLEGAMRRQLVSEYPTLEGASVKFDVDSALDNLEFVDRMSDLFDRNALTINELIHQTGYGKQFVGGDVRNVDIRERILKASTAQKGAQPNGK